MPHRLAPRCPTRRRRRLGALLLACLPWSPQALAGCVEREPTAYRETEFRAPVPCTLRGGEVLSTESLYQLVQGSAAVLVDVLPAPRRPAGLGDDALWVPPVRDSIPGSVWLPNTGFGTLPLPEERYLRRNLAALTGNDLARAVVFFCLRDCWMSWNAARRAIAWGYRRVYWYPDGTDGWTEAGHALERIEPVPRAADQ